MAQWRTQGCKKEDWSMFTWNQTHRNLLMILPSSFLSTHWFIVQTIDFIHGSGGVLWQVVSVVWALIRWFRGLSTLTGLDLQTHLREVTHYISSVQIHFSALVRKWLTDCHSKCSDLGFANCFSNLWYWNSLVQWISSGIYPKLLEEQTEVTAAGEALEVSAGAR